MIKRIEFCHNSRLIHRDIKPSNFRIGQGNKSHLLFMTNFRNATKYMSSSGKHLKFRDCQHSGGTMRYASLNVHVGIECSRRDDLESLIYVLIYFLKGELPWQNLKAKTIEEKFAKILHTKVTISIEDICSGLPSQFKELLSYARCLEYEQKPNYRYIKKKITTLFSSCNYQHDMDFDWNSAVKNTETISQSTAETIHETSFKKKSLS